MGNKGHFRPWARLRAWFTRWAYHKNYMPDDCPWYLRAAMPLLLSWQVYFFIAFRPTLWERHRNRKGAREDEEASE